MATPINLVNYSRQADMDIEMSNIYDSLNIIIGCGGVGFWLGLLLAMTGAKNLLLIEGEKIDYSNLNRLPVPQTWVGINKAVALRKLIHMLRPDTNVLIITHHITPESLSIIKKFTDKVSSIYYKKIWDTTDNARIQRKIYDFASKNNINYHKIGYEAYEIGCYKKYDVWIDENNYQTGYRTSRANAITSALSAGLGIFNELFNNNYKDFHLDFKELIRKGGNNGK